MEIPLIHCITIPQSCMKRRSTRLSKHSLASHWQIAAKRALPLIILLPTTSCKYPLLIVYLSICLVSILLFIYIQVDSPFWKRKIQTNTAPSKRTKTTSRGPGHLKKPTTQEQLALGDSEIELDSLGILFMQLIDADSPQEETETSQADGAEVIPVSSDSENLPREKTRRVVRKVRF